MKFVVFIISCFIAGSHLNNQKQFMHSILLPCCLITVFWLLCLQVKMAGPYSHFDRPLWRARPCRKTLWAYRLLMQIGQLELSSVLFIQYELQKLKFNFRGSIILVFQCIAWKGKTTQMTKGAKERHHTVKSYHNYAKVYKCTGNKTLSLT